MAALVQRVSNWSAKELEASLLPTKGNIIKRIAVYAYQFFKFLVMLPIAATFSLLASLTRLCTKKPVDSPLTAFAKNPKWGPPVGASPVPIGVSTADYQENGPKVHPLTNWGKHDINHVPDGDFGEMPDIWNHPERAIERVRELGLSHYRCSVSRDKLQPQKDGPLDPEAVQHLRDRIRLFQANGIELMFTIDHFAEPLYFSWKRPEDVAGFVNFADQVSEILYEEGIRKVLTVNEPTVVAFQGWVMGEFPPYGKIDFETSAQVIENMMRAHTQIYEKVKARHPEMQIGLSHDPITFSNWHKHNPLFMPAEKLTCHYLSEVNGGALMRFLQTGKFELKVPFRCNYSFEMPKPPPLDFIGVQYYTRPLLKISPCGAGSVTRNEDEKLTSYDYRQYPQGLASTLEEFSKLKTPEGKPMPIEITEVGIDRGINKDASDKERIAYYDKLLQVVQLAKKHGVDVRSLYFWTLIDNSEWYKRWAVKFGLYEFNPKNGEITQLPAARWVSNREAARKALAAGA